MPRPSLIRLIACLFCLAAVGALHAAAAAGDGKIPVPEPIDWSGYPKPAKAGPYDDELKNPKTHALIMKYKMFAPKVLPEEKHLGVVLCFHGFRGNETHLAPPVYASMKAAGLGENYLIAGLKSSGEGWAPADEIEVLRYIDWLKATYPIDTRRIFIWGMSNGAWMVSWFGGRHQDMVAGVVRYCGYPPTVPPEKEAATTQTEYYLVHGDADESVNVSGSRELRKSLLQNHYHFVYRELDGKGHVEIINNLLVREDACRWIDSLRHKEVPLPAADEKFLRQFSDGKKSADLFAKPEVWNELLRIGGPAAGQAVAKAMKSDSATAREMAAIACSRGIFSGDETVDGLIRLADDKTAGVRAAALKALTVVANWRYEAAQIALGKIAINKKRPEEERTLAVTGLAKDAEAPLLGNFDDDQTTFQALVALLDGDDQNLRTLAFAPLKVAVKDGLGYAPEQSAADRKGPIAKWREWFTERNKAPADGKGNTAAK